jgi:hypothetical protein
MRAGGEGRGWRRFDGELGGVRRVGGHAGGGVHSTPELDDGMEEEVHGDLHQLQGGRETPRMMGEEGWSQAAVSDGLFVAQHSCTLCVIFDNYIFIRYACPLSAIHVDLHRVGYRQEPRGGRVWLCAAVLAENEFSAAFGMVRRR